MKLFSIMSLLLAMALFVAMPAAASADINGFNNLTGWTYNQGDAGGNTASVNGDSVTITNGGTGQRRNIWFDVQQDIQQFSASFNYKATRTGFDRGGLTFIIHNDANGLNTVANQHSGFGFSGIDTSAATTFEIGSVAMLSGFFRNGVVGSGSELTDSQFATSEGGVDVSINYTGSILSVAIDDGTNASYIKNHFISPSLQNTLGSDRAFVGFGASVTSGALTQTISNFRFTSTAVPEPTSGIVLLLGGLGTLLRRRRI